MTTTTLKTTKTQEINALMLEYQSALDYAIEYNAHEDVQDLVAYYEESIDVCLQVPNLTNASSQAFDLI